MLIRPASEADLAALVALDSFASSHPQRRIDIAAWIAAGACHVATEGAALGYLAIAPSFFHQPMVEMLIVDPGARGRGTGLALLTHASALGPGKLWCSTNRSNGPMRRLLGRAGFVYAGQVDHLDDGDPELVFVRLPG